LISALDAVGALAGVYYGGDSLSWRQLGTPERAHGAVFIRTRRQRAEAFRRSITDSNGAHLMVSFANRLCFGAMARCAAAGKPYFVLAESFTPRGRSPRGLVRDTVYRYLLRRVSGAFALAPACALDFLRVGVPMERIHPGAYPGPDAFRRYRQPASRRIVFCGRLVRIKGMDVLASALGILARDGEPLTLDVVGEGPALDECLPEFSRSPVRVVRHGAVSSERVTEILEGASALVVPTRVWEGWGYVVNEAIAAGIPVVASDIVAAREVIVDGRNGAVFRSEDPSSLAQAIERAFALHADAGGLTQAIDATRAGLGAGAFARYMVSRMQSAMDGAAPTAEPPWHRAVTDLGGNPETRWWREAKR
jgi:glycosyltransferase involved in cell wall biosynthesis